MLKIPAAVPPFDPARADMRLPDAALKFRTDNQLTDTNNLRRLNITAWLYRDKQGMEGIKVNPNTTIAQLLAQFGPADTRDAEVGIHSEGAAAEFFRTNPDLKVLQIFSERIPCATMCAPLLRNYFSGLPIFYYYDRNAWGGTKSAADILSGIYGSGSAAAPSMAELENQFFRLRNAKDLTKSDHRAQLKLVRNSWNPMGRAVQALNPVDTPELDIWDDVEESLNAVKRLVIANNPMKAAAFLMAARLQYILAVRTYVRWKDGLDAGVTRTYIAIGVVAAAAIAAAVAVFALAAAAPVVEGAVAVENAAQTLTRIQLLSEQADTFIRIASCEGEPIRIIEEILETARAMK